MTCDAFRQALSSSRTSGRSSTLVLPAFHDRIQDAYERLGHRWGWRFLASPARTLSAETRLAFVGLNPGGSTYHPPQVSTEEGNAYRVERWGRGGRLDPLQVQMRRMYEEIAARRPGTASAVELMDATLAGNFCPFRSPDWKSLTRPAESAAFSRALWADVFDVADPRVIVCFGDVGQHLAAIMQQRGARLTAAAQTRSAGWGNVTYSTARYATTRGETLIVRLPHLSRFGIFGRPQSQHAVHDVATAIAEATGGRLPDQPSAPAA